MLAGRPAPGLAPREAAWPRAIGAVTRWRDAARVGLDAAWAAARGTRKGAVVAKEAIAEKTGAAGDVVSKVGHVPADVAREVRLELDAWSRGMLKRIAGGVAVGALALVALIVITVGVVALLNELVGDPYGTLIVGALYVVAAFAGIAWMARAAGKAEAIAEAHNAHAQAAVSLEPPEEVVRERAGDGAQG